MSVMQATSVAFEMSCNFCVAVRRQVVTTLKPIFDGIVLGQQLRINYLVAQQLAGKGEYKGMTVAEAITLAERIEHNAPTSIRATLTALDAITEDDDAAGWAATEAALNAILTSKDREEGLAAFFGRRPPEWPGR